MGVAIQRLCAQLKPVAILLLSTFVRVCISTLVLLLSCFLCHPPPHRRPSKWDCQGMNSCLRRALSVLNSVEHRQFRLRSSGRSVSCGSNAENNLCSLAVLQHAECVIHLLSHV